MKRTFCLVFLASTAVAQVPLRGVAYDSLHGRPLSGAFIGIAGLSVSAVSDSTGHFVLMGVPKGSHRVVMQHDVLDAIGLSSAAARVTVNTDRDTVVVAVPAFGTLFRNACGREGPTSPDSGLVFGAVTRGGQPIPLAVVAASWLDLSMDSTKAVRQKQKVMEVDADSSGNFALCGVPTNTGLSLRASLGAYTGIWTDVAPLDKERVARRDLTIVTISPTQLRFDPPQTTTFAGRVQSDARQPVEDADVLIVDLGLSTSTNSRGEFRIAGLTPGTHAVQVRKIGFSFSEQRIEFGADPVDRTLVMSRITLLDSVSVKAPEYSPNDEAMRLFNENRKLGLGKFFTRADLEKARDRSMISILSQLPGVKPERGSGGQGWLMSSRPNKSLNPGCVPPKQDHPETDRAPVRLPCLTACFVHVFLDGVDVSNSEVPNINRFNPNQLEAVEYYAGGSQVPPEYNKLNKAYCGVVVLHTRRGKET